MDGKIKVTRDAKRRAKRKKDSKKKKKSKLVAVSGFRGDVFPAEVRYVSAMTARIRFVQQLLMLGPLEGQLFLEWDIVSESTDLKENGTNVGGKGLRYL
ncbi:hypothetical protein CEXT_470301 [Caerostris extrusa]|uniref:Uncharacterized protein n=1 Tax=Caerostris extrusa TaxID=172846 RepID=A0AAV4QJW1_CAEEX|nr:hypothetical protein CEXT_470301 [Caerostris extrusa]